MTKMQNRTTSVELVNDDDSMLLFKSVFTKWNSKMSTYSFTLEPDRIDVYGMKLSWLYKLAYIGRPSWNYGDSLYNEYYLKPILEIKDTGKFIPNHATGEGIFSYSARYPRNNKYSFEPNDAYLKGLLGKEDIRLRMQRDLNNYFNYDVQIETRKVPVYNLVVKDDRAGRLKTKGGRTKLDYPDGSYAGINAKNITISQVIQQLVLSRRPASTHEIPIFDATEIKDNIDIKIDAIFFEDWLKELQKNGLDVVLTEKDMKCIVVRDPALATHNTP